MTQHQPPDWITEMIRFMQQLDCDLTDAGGLVEARGLVDGSQARTVSLVDGDVVVTDGPYAESKESLIGYWVVDVESETRALEIAGRIVVWSGSVELRQVGEAPPEV